jgi:pantetheine-phosphate adenylyltransferase
MTGEDKKLSSPTKKQDATPLVQGKTEMSKGIYAGTFDPITFGHLDIIQRSLKFCSHLVVAVGVNPKKTTLFTDEERVKMINRVVDSLDFLDSTRVSVCSFDGLLVTLAKSMDAKVLIRGIRSVSDFEYEINLANVNKTIAPSVDTIFLPTSPEMVAVSSSAVKEIARHSGNIEKFVPPYIAEMVHSKFGFTKLGNSEK